ncbi:hypothetical protein F2P81_021601 [Scophthalmus maximus]|uniref:Uncharacterized protein n=1 Tax=Scophthalmus maximus TaxID=52904 RepID=A0A6A4S8C0_SCOMX|nr:hypothetical protein F2P81_021601 [Scophthalmus maximus]
MLGDGCNIQTDIKLLCSVDFKKPRQQISSARSKPPSSVCTPALISVGSTSGPREPFAVTDGRHFIVQT